MSNLTADRKTQFLGNVLTADVLGPYGAAATTSYYKGLAQTLDSSARPKNPGTITEKVIGVVKQFVDNSVGANDAQNVEFMTGIFKFDKHGDRPPTAADVLKPGYFSDNHTVSRTASDGSIGGLIILVESDGVWMWMGPLAVASASLGGLTATALTDNSGGAAADGTIGVVTAPTAIAATLTDSTGLSGTHDDVLAATTVPADIAGGESPTEGEFNALLAVIRVMAQNESDLAQKVIELVAAQAQDRTAIVALTDAVKELSSKINTIISDLA